MEKLFSSKANTLNILQSNKELSVPPLKIVSYADWRADRSLVLSEVEAFFRVYGENISLAVRSSCSREDGNESSGAGAFTSLLYVKNNSQDLAKAIEEVFASYTLGAMVALDADQVLIQLMLENIIINGVIMSYVSDDGSPYYVINYDESSQADTITSGRGKTKLIYVYRDFKREDFDSEILYQCVEIASILERKCNNKFIDIEFCVTSDGVFHLLQVRPICTKHQWIPNAESHVQNNLDFVTDFLHDLMSPREGLAGKTTFLGVMPDWNPAEMIGITPKTLSSSLYREFITRRVWSTAREQMGYKQLPPDELMVLIAGRPYIDVRLSFNSFLPQNIDKETGRVLVDAWLERLNHHTYYHDKIEFEVAQTLLDFTFEENMQSRYPNLLNSGQKKNYKELLRTFTQNNVSLQSNSSFAWAMRQIEKLKAIQDKHSLFVLTNNRQSTNALRRVVGMTEECKNWGTLPFSILARHAFMAESLLRSAVARGALSQERYEHLKSTMKTISTEFANDFLLASQNDEDKQNFLAKYGHLRPSTYDLTSPRYIDRDSLFDKSPHAVGGVFEHEIFQLTNSEISDLTKLIEESQLDFTPLDLIAYASRAIPAREYAKFIFTRHISDILEWLAVWGEQHDLSREELTFLDFRDITEWTYHALLSPPKKHFLELVERGKILYDLGRSLKLPYLIRSPRDLYVAPQHNSAPNFIGSACIEAPVTHLFADSDCSENISGHIVCIENADPGFDWIFTRNIAGLITLFGGANSHMAIRCAEYGLPAAIGVGSTIFNKVIALPHCTLDAQSKRIVV